LNALNHQSLPYHTQTTLTKTKMVISKAHLYKSLRPPINKSLDPDGNDAWPSPDLESDDDESLTVQTRLPPDTDVKAAFRPSLIFVLFIFTVVTVLVVVAVSAASPAASDQLQNLVPTHLEPLLKSAQNWYDSNLGYEDSHAQEQKFLDESDSVPFLRAHGAHIRSGFPRYRAVEESALEILRDHLQSTDIVQGNVLIVAIANGGFMPMVLNWLCYLERHKITNFLIGTADDESEIQLRSLGYGHNVMSMPRMFNDSDYADCRDNKAHGYRSRCFNRYAEFKLKLVIATLLLGHDMILCDLDVIFIHNPLLYMPLIHDWEFQLEPHHFCAGFYFNRACTFTVEMQMQVFQGILNRRELDDQVSICAKPCLSIVVCPSCLF